MLLALSLLAKVTIASEYRSGTTLVYNSVMWKARATFIDSDAFKRLSHRYRRCRSGHPAISSILNALTN
jgi:hypothetical protein